jgi:diguanylate cyclase (GGDEF)-like protein/PAS domain S-box-containing protein
MTTSSLRLGRRIIAPTAALMAISLGVLIGLMAVNAATEDETARLQSINTVQNNLSLRESQVGRVAKDYAWWNDAVRNLHIDVDLDWADLNVAGYIYETHGFHATLVVNAENHTTYGAIEGERVPIDTIPEISGGLELLIAAARQSSEDEPDYQTGLVLIDGAVALSGVSAITPEEIGDFSVPPDERSVLIFIKRLDQAFFKDLAERYQLTHMHIGEANGETDLAALDLTTVDGTPAGRLLWQPHRPGQQFLHSIAPSLLLALVFITGFSAFVMRHTGQAARAIEDSQARFRDVADASSDWIWETDGALTLVFVSERVGQLTGRSPETIVGRKLDSVFYQGDNTSQWTRYQKALERPQPFRNVLALCDNAEGGRLTVRIAGKPGFDKTGRFVGFRGTATDITRELEAERRAQFLTRHDALTGLPNRSVLGERLDDAISVVSRRNEMAAVLSVDLDRFKEVNDTLGHATGDALIVQVAQRLEACVRETDTLARIGGDEFVIIQNGVHDVATVEILARRILEVIAQPFDIDDERLLITTSIGIAMIPLDGSLGGRLLQSADIALDRAKTESRGTFRFFERQMDASLQDRKALERDLRLAIVRHELDVFFQPKIDVPSGQVSGVEALVRWHHPERGMVPPSSFIDVAEQTGLIHELGEWVLRTACTILADYDELEVAVNLSAVQLKRGGIADMVANVLAETALEPRRLEIEITESVMVDGAEGVIADLRRIKDMGVRIAMDDFGTGYSSLSYLNRFPFDKIKIDRSFVNDLNHRGNGSAIVKAVVGIGKSLGIKICAEGVETIDQLRFLERVGCHEVQGYYFAKPMPISGLDKFLSNPCKLTEPAA